MTTRWGPPKPVTGVMTDGSDDDHRHHHRGAGRLVDDVIDSADVDEATQAIARSIAEAERVGETVKDVHLNTVDALLRMVEEQAVDPMWGPEPEALKTELTAALQGADRLALRFVVAGERFATEQPSHDAKENEPI